MRRLLGIIVGSAAGVAVCLAMGLAGPGGERPRARFLSECSGHLTRVLVHYDPRARDLLVPVYRDILAALSPDTEVVVAVASSADFEGFSARLRAQGEPGPERLSPLVVGRRISAWSRDRFITAASADRPVLIVPPQTMAPLETRANDWVVPWTLAARSRGTVQTVRAPFAFDGGDVAVDGRHVFATSVILRRNEGNRHERPAEMRRALGELSGLEPVLIGASGESVPAHHVGMFIAPIDDGTILVGDPGLGRRIVEQLPPPTAAALGADFSGPTAERFRNVTRALREAGLRVVPIPIVPTADELVYLTYTNAVIDERPDGRHVLMPTYGVPELDAAGESVWEEQGFVVHPVDVSRLYRNGGAVHCLIGVVSR